MTVSGCFVAAAAADGKLRVEKGATSFLRGSNWKFTREVESQLISN
jgi:hypothetical protein